jgi:TRAP-type C4-dicarboxylate transport system permease small subunit
MGAGYTLLHDGHVRVDIIYQRLGVKGQAWVQLRGAVLLLIPGCTLVLIGDIVGVSVGDLFIGAVLPGLLLVSLFIIYILIVATLRPDVAPAISREELADEVVEEEAAKSDMAKKVNASFRKFQKVVGSWGSVSEKAYYDSIIGSMS